MQILMEKINFNINSPFLPVALVILSLLICSILFMLYYGSIILIKMYVSPPAFRKQERSRDRVNGKSRCLTGRRAQQVRLTGNSFVLNDYNQAAYKKLNRIRDRILPFSRHYFPDSSCTLAL